MSIVNPTQVPPSSEITSSSVNTPVNELAAVINGQIDDTNISGVSGSKLSNGSVTTAKLDDGAVTPDKRSGGYAIGTFSVSATGNIVVTGIGFKPKFVRLIASNASSDAYAESNEGSFDEDGNQRYLSTRVAGASSNFTRSGTNSALGYWSTPGGTITRYMNLTYVSMDADGFTVNNSTHAGGPYTVHYEARA